MSRYTNILSIGGSDCSGGAGIQADVRVAMLCGVNAATAVTAVTVQNSSRFISAGAVGAESLKAQIEAVATDITIGAVKIGMVPDEELVAAIAECIDRFKLPNIVIDPVEAPTVSNHAKTSAYDALADILLPKASVITPNLAEAVALFGSDSDDLPYQLHCKFGVPTVLVKGGDAPGDSVSDLFYNDTPRQYGRFFASKIDSRNTHGSGCVLSTAIACGLALGKSPMAAIADAERLVRTLIKDSADYDHGAGKYGPLGYIDYLKHLNQ